MVETVGQRGYVLATASYDNTIRFWNPSTGANIHTVPHAECQSNALEVTPDGSMLASAGYQRIRMYDLAANAAEVVNYDSVSKNVTAVGFHAKQHFMFTGGEDCTARIWDIRSRSPQCQRIFQVNTSVNSVCLHPINQVELFVGDASGILYLWDLRNDQNVQLALEQQPTSIQSLCVDAEGTMVAAVTNKGYAYLWNLCGGGHDVDGAARSTQPNPKMKVSVHGRYALRCRFSPDSTLLATTSADGTARLWRTADVGEVATLRPPSDKESQRWVWDCAFTADARHLFTCSSDGCMRLWRADSGALVRTFAGHQRAITAMAFRDGPPADSPRAL